MQYFDLFEFVGMLNQAVTCRLAAILDVLIILVCQSIWLILQKYTVYDDNIN